MTLRSVSDATSTDHLLDRMVPTDLESLDRVAALRARVDRKYVVSEMVVDQLLDELGADLHALEIEGLRTFRYTSLYFDTPDLASYRGAAHRRRRRFKVRTRVYEEQATCNLEIKTRTLRGQTLKERLPHDVTRRRVLTAEARAFVDERLPVVGSPLTPVAQTAYRRSTLLDRRDASRTTIDRDLRCSDPSGRVPGHLVGVVVETKSTGSTTSVDRWLWHHHIRPVRISKFCVAMAMQDPSLPTNRWARVLRRHVDPDRSAVDPAGRDGREASPTTAHGVAPVSRGVRAQPRLG